jgi:polysaccharide deacetylase 2 family uncharacterized protein YibQ
VTDLSAPLTRRRARATQKEPRRQDGGRHLPVARLAVAGIAVLLTAVAVRILVVDTPDGGRPAAEVAINAANNANPVAGANATPSSSVISIGPELTPEEVGPALAAGADHPPVAKAATAGTPDAFGALPDLLEDTEYGSLPRISGTGETPFAAYARPSVTPASAGGKALVAIVVTGLGINVAGSLDAVSKLPDTVTLAFAPYGKSLDQTVGAAHAEGHEIFLEVPLEPFDYPDNDPGPDTLLTGQAPRDNMDKLYRVMGKFGGYAGLINNMGARFTASGADFSPMMEELGARGLGYIDDGSSNRSVAPQLATANRVPFAKASMTLDGNPSRKDILDQLTALEDLARKSGSAIGLISALPISIQTIVEWSKDAEDRGILLVPASALMTK